MANRLRLSRGRMPVSLDYYQNAGFMIDPQNTYISLSRTAGDALRQLGVVGASEDGDDIKRIIVAAASSGDIVPVESTKELHCIAKAMIAGECVYLILVTSKGSPAGNKDWTTIVKGVMQQQDFERLMNKRKGLAPISRHISKGRSFTNE